MIYKIIYKRYNVVQFKKLIEHEYFLEYRKLTNRKSEIDKLIKDKKTADKELLRDELKEMSPVLKEFKKPFFTTKSPIYDSISTGILSLPSCQGGDSEVEIVLCKENIIDDYE